jgi:hypothetical protein
MRYIREFSGHATYVKSAPIRPGARLVWMIRQGMLIRDMKYDTSLSSSCTVVELSVILPHITQCVSQTCRFAWKARNITSLRKEQKKWYSDLCPASNGFPFSAGLHRAHTASLFGIRNLKMRTVLRKHACHLVYVRFVSVDCSRERLLGD